MTRPIVKDGKLGVSSQLVTEKKEIHQDELFAPHQEEKSSSAKRLKPCNPKRILVEGDPGMGKTTLCQNLAFRWGHEECTGECKCAPCVHSWTFVVYLTAANLKGFTDIHTAIRDHLLRESSIEEVKAALKSSQSNTLFIIDSYDEGFKDNVLLRDLIQGR
uniref:NACHT domain-containing protein n=1 Tax=Capitella teleta TaxID=283909 RepID=X1ZN79_CAPTE